MKIVVRAKPWSKEDRVEKMGEFEFVVWVKAPAVQGKANTAIIKLLADYFKVSASCVNIVSGFFAKTKVIEISESYEKNIS